MFPRRTGREGGIVGSEDGVVRAALHLGHHRDPAATCWGLTEMMASAELLLLEGHMTQKSAVDVERLAADSQASAAWLLAGRASSFMA